MKEKELKNDKRGLYLMIFVLSTTFIIFTIWIVDIKNVFSRQSRNADNTSGSISESFFASREGFDFSLDDFMSEMESSLSGEVDDLKFELEKDDSILLEEAVRVKLEEKKASLEDDLNAQLEDDENDRVNDLRIKIEELERQIEFNRNSF